VASWCDVNVYNMPELSWAPSYPDGVAMIVLSAVLPIA
jgi:hypothetical protein